MRQLKITVVGCGIAGLTTANRLIDDGHQVRLISDLPVDKTTSNVAAAFWYPFWTGETPDHSWYQEEWAEFTFRKYVNEFFNDAPGVTKVPLVEFFDSSLSEIELQGVIRRMWWARMPELGFKILPTSESQFTTPAGVNIQSGISFSTIVVSMGPYLKYLLDKFQTTGGQFATEHIGTGNAPSSTFSKLVNSDNDLVVNCTGLGARVLFSDTDTEAVEGIVMCAENSIAERKITLLHTGVYSDAPIYVVPRLHPDNDIVLGGTLNQHKAVSRSDFDEYEWGTLSKASGGAKRIKLECSEILKRCQDYVPSVSNLKIKNVKAGFRPRRTPKVRLEFEYPNLVHNYGHGGGGMTLAWGCAEWIAKNLNERANAPFDAFSS